MRKVSKVLALLAIVLTAVALSVCLYACDKNVTPQGNNLTSGHITHTPAADWSGDELSHWKLCEEGGERLEVGQHSYQAKTDAVNHYKQCSVCGKKIEEQPHSLTLKYNGEQHFLACDCGYTQDVSNHTLKLVNEGAKGHHYECTDPDCHFSTATYSHTLKATTAGEDGHVLACTTDGCGYHSEEAVAHVPSSTAVNTDSEHHTFTCTVCGDSVVTSHNYRFVSLGADQCREECSVCGAAKEAQSHTADATLHNDGAQHYSVCTDCNQKFGYADHTQQGEVQYADGEHWYLCACGAEVGREAHKMANEQLSHDDANHYNVCDVCNQHYNIVAHSYSSYTNSEPGKHSATCECGYDLDGDCTSDGLLHYNNDENPGKHWNQCSVCGSKMNETEHVKSTVSISDEQHQVQCDCGYTEEAASHSLSYAPSEDTHTHTVSCSGCNYKLEGQAHTGESYTPGDHVHSYTCTLCEQEVTGEACTPADTYEQGETDHTLKCKLCSGVLEQEAHKEAWRIYNKGTAIYSGKHEGYCEVCGKVTTAAATHQKFTDFLDAGGEVALTDKTYHYYVCQVCNIRVYQSHGNSASTSTRMKLEYREGDYENHWLVCGCGYEKAVAHSKLSTNTSTTVVTDEGDIGHSYTCSTCKGKVIVPHEYRDQNNSSGVVKPRQNADHTGHTYTCLYTKCKHQPEAVPHTKVEGSEKAVYNNEHHTYTCSECGLTDCWEAHSPVNVTYPGEEDYTECTVCNLYITDWQFDTIMDGEAYAITKYNGAETDVTLPIKYKGKPVIELGTSGATANTKKVFSKTMTKVVIPEGFTAIHPYAMYGTITNLYLPSTMLTLDNNAFRDSTIDNVYFADLEKYIGYCTLFSLYSSPFNKKSNQKTSDAKTQIYAKSGEDYQHITDLVLSSNVDLIGDYVLDGAGIKSVTLPKELIYIGQRAFDSTAMEKVYISSIEDYLGVVRYDSSSNALFVNAGTTQLYITGQEAPLTELHIPATVDTIPRCAFYNTAGITKVYLPETVKSIENYAFYMKNIEEVHITDMHKYLSAVTAHYSASPFVSSNNAKLYLDDQVVTDIEIDDTYDALGYGFAYYQGLTKVTISGVKPLEIGNYAFYKCGLTQLTMSDRVTSIGEYAFSKIAFTEPITLSKNIATIGQYAFDSATFLLSLDGMTKLTGIGNHAFNTVALPETFRLPETISVLGDGVFQEAKGNKVFIMPTALLVAPSYAAPKECEKIIFPKGSALTSIKSQSAFRYSKATEMVLPHITTGIDSSAGFNTTLTTVYYGGTEEEWTALQKRVTQLSSVKTVFYNEEEYPGDGKCDSKFYFLEDGVNVGYWMDGVQTKGKYVIMSSTYRKLSVVGKTEWTLTMSKPKYASGDVVYSSEDKDVIDITEDGQVTFKKHGVAMVKIALKDDPTIYAMQKLMTYTNTYYLAGTINGEDMSALAEKSAKDLSALDGRDAYKFTASNSNTVFDLVVALKANDTVKIAGLGLDESDAIGSKAFDKENSENWEQLVDVSGDTIKFLKDTTYKIHLDLSGEQPVLTINEKLTVTYTVHIWGRSGTILANGSYASATVEFDIGFTGTKEVVIKLSGSNITAKSYTNIQLVVEGIDGVEKDAYAAKKTCTYSGAKWARSKTSSRWCSNGSATNGELWYEGNVTNSMSWTFTITINEKGAISKCAITA